jgi:hypothetical protein
MLRHPGFVFAVVLSVVLRVYLAVFTEGTDDARLWEMHARGINTVGLTEYYRQTAGQWRVFNHPPAAGLGAAAVWDAAGEWGVPFKIPFRLLVTSLDYVAAFFLLRILVDDPRRYFLTAFYLLNPLTLLLSAFHHNTDSLVGLFLLLSVYFLGRGRYLAAGAALGAGMSVKWIILLGLPALFFAVHPWRAKLKFTGALALVALLGYGRYLVADQGVLTSNLFGYTGQLIHAAGGVPIWGNRIFLARAAQVVPFDAVPLMGVLLKYNSLVVFSAVVAHAWISRGRTGAGVGRTVAEGLVLFYALSNFWSFQYFAWCLPLLVFLPPILLWAISLGASAYLYAIYAAACRSPWLLGTWNILREPSLPGAVWFFRDAALGTVLAAAGYLVLKSPSTETDEQPAPTDSELLPSAGG